MSLIIGIGGASQSGKSTFSAKLKKLCPTRKVHIIEMDNYTRPEKDMPKINERIDWEGPESIDYDLILNSIRNSLENYDIIIIEGMLAFANKTLNKEYDLKIFIKIEKNTFIRRRKRETRWGKEPAWYLEHVWESYLKFGQYNMADIYISGESDFSGYNLDAILQKIDTSIT